MVTSRFSHEPNQTVNCPCPPGKCICGTKPIKVKDLYSRGYGRSANWYWTDPDSPDVTAESPGADAEDMGYPND